MEGDAARQGEGADWRGAALARAQGHPAIFRGACMAANLFKQAAPANDPTRGLSYGA